MRLDATVHTALTVAACSMKSEMSTSKSTSKSTLLGQELATTVVNGLTRMPWGADCLELFDGVLQELIRLKEQIAGGCARCSRNETRTY